MVTSVDVYKEIRRLQLEGVTSQRAAAKRLGISRNTVKKYWEGNAVPWDRKEYSREAAVMTPEVVQFISSCLDEDDRERVKKAAAYCPSNLPASGGGMLLHRKRVLRPESGPRYASSQKGNSGLRSLKIRSRRGCPDRLG